MKHIFIAFVISITIFASCEKATQPIVTVNNFVATIAENPTMNQSVGNVSATITDANNTRYYFTSTQDDLRNHIALNSSTGEITITDPDYFDYEQRISATTTAAVQVADENSAKDSASFTITINLSDVSEIVPTAPEVLSTNYVSYDATSAIMTGTITSDGNSPILERGIVFSTTTYEPTISDSKIVDDSLGIGTFTVLMSGLTSNTSYSVRSYATNSVGTSYGWLSVFTTKLAIGSMYQGGMVAYILQPGDTGYDPDNQHGLVAALSDQNTSIPWALTLTATGATSQDLGSGMANTGTIVVNQGAGNYAAKLCEDLVLNDWYGWYLPSLTELNKLYLSKDIIGGFDVAFYWSSSEADANSAWVQSFNSDSQTAATKTDTYHVRAVNSF